MQSSLCASVWLLWLFSGILFMGLSGNPMHLLIFLAVLCLISARLRINFLKALVPAAIFGMPLFFVNILVVGGGEHVILELPRVFPLARSITYESLMNAAYFFLLLVNMILAFSIFTRMTSSDELIRLMSSYAASSALLIGLVVRFIPSIYSDAKSVLDSQKARGLDIGLLRGLKRIKAISSLSVPVFVLSLERSINIAESIESRGYGAGRTDYFARPKTSREKAVSTVMALNIVLTLALRVQGILGEPYAGFTSPLDYRLLLLILSFAAVAL
jgi:energy-coupling factor transport system permease protein